MLAVIKNGKILCYGCYEVKDYLKALGFYWDAENKVWSKEVSNFLLKELKELGVQVITELKPDEKLMEELKSLYPFAMPHQIVGTALALQNKSFLLGDEPGVGKTVQGLMYMDYLLGKEIIDFAIVMCPASVKRQWQTEVYKFLQQTLALLTGDKRYRKRLFEEAIKAKYYYPAVIMNYELLLRDEFEYIMKLKERGIRFALILDEASRFKNKDSQTYKKLKEIAKLTEYKLAMTGTPVENHLVEFWAIASILRSGFMTYKEFEQKHCIVSEVKLPNIKFPIKKVVGYKNLAGFLARISDFYIRRKKADIKEMPPLTEYTIEIELTDLQLKLEDYLTKDIAQARGLSLEQIITLLRVINDDPRLLLRSQSEKGHELAIMFRKEIEAFKQNPKIEALYEVLLEHEEDKKILVFTSFAEMAKSLAKEFNSLLVIGSMNEKERARVIGEFKSRQNRRMLIATDALTYGVSLDEADIVIHFDIPWSVGKLVQRTDRIYRITSTRNKWVYFFVGSGIERKVWEILNSKRQLFNKVVEGHALEDEDLRQMLLKALSESTSYNK